MNNTTAMENILLELLDSTEETYHTRTQYENHLYFYPNGLNATIYVECDNSTSLIASFKFEQNKNGERKDYIVSHTVGSIYDMPKLVAKLYQKLNNNYKYDPENHEERIKTLEDIFELKNISPSNFLLEGKNEELKVKAQHNNHDIIVHLGKTIFPYGKPREFNPLEPVIFDCWMRNIESQKSTAMKFAIPYFQLHHYEILKNIVPEVKDTNNLDYFIEAIHEINPQAASHLNAIKLNSQLSIKENEPHRKLKI